MPTFRVRWEIDVQAKDAMDAAMNAEAIMRTPVDGSPDQARVFDVTRDDSHICTRVDLADMRAWRITGNPWQQNFNIEEASNDQNLYIEVLEQGRVYITRGDDGLTADIYPLQHWDRPIASVTVDSAALNAPADEALADEPAKYSHQFGFSFSVESTDRTGERIPAALLRQKLAARLAQLDDDELLDALGPPRDRAKLS